jgi:hypothetical protein
MALSRRVVETLLDLVEIKLSCMEVHDREDSREALCLEACRNELKTLLAGGSGPVTTFPRRTKGRSRAAV